MGSASSPSTSGDQSDTATERVPRRGLFAAGIAGFGFSGLVDVLVLHHVLQWHHLLSGIYPMDTLAGLRTNLLADGLFSLAMLLVASVGAGLLWKVERRTTVPLAVRPVVGAGLVGLGLFDLFDVVVDHVLLGLHQPLSQGGQYNPHWAAVSLLFIVAGYLLYQRSDASEARATSNAD